MPWAGAAQWHTLYAMAHEGMAHGGGTPLAGVCCTMAYIGHCPVMSELGPRARAPIAICIKLPAGAAVLVFWPHPNGNAPRQFGIRAVFFAVMLLSMHKPRASKRKIKSAAGLPNNLRPHPVLFGRLPYELRAVLLLVYWPV